MPERFINSIRPTLFTGKLRLAVVGVTLALVHAVWSVGPVSANDATVPSAVATQGPPEAGDASDANAAPGSRVAEIAQAESQAKADSALSTAVALNYCRASFHRIRKDPSDRVLLEEQEKILNNLNLGQLNDQEVITLYTSVLEEIGQISIADQERIMHRTHHNSQISRKITWDAVAFGTDLMSAQFGNAVKTGANSWWDYRNQVYQRDVTIHNIDKARHLAVIQRSNTFLDTFWKMARKKEIPDRWLIRGDDLDQLEVATQERDAEVRLRILRRMEGYMEAYPPYWYYVAKTCQELGKLGDAVEIYNRLERLGQGHFRKDELLATAMANQAAILDYQKDNMAVASARKALDYSTDVWEANLIAARVLQRHGQVADAEDAILRNLDVELEQSQSQVFLASLYFFSHQEEKLVAMLNNPKAVAHLPAPVLLRCAAMVGAEKTPPLVVNNILASLEAYPRGGKGSEQVLVRVGNVWQLHLARLEAFEDGNRLANPQIEGGKGYYDLKFASSNQRGFSFSPAPQPKELTLVLSYPDETTVRLTLNRDTTARNDRGGLTFASSPSSSLKISSIKVGEDLFALSPREARAAPEDSPQQHETARPDFDAMNQDSVPADQRRSGFVIPFIN